MDFDVFKSLINSLTWGNDIGLTPIIGDPLLDPGLMEKIKYAKKTGKKKFIFFQWHTASKNDNYKNL